MNHIASYFESYPLSPECHETSDSMLFHKNVDAKNHSVSLKDKEIKLHKRPDAKAAVTDSKKADADKQSISNEPKAKRKKKDAVPTVVPPVVPPAKDAANGEAAAGAEAPKP